MQNETIMKFHFTLIKMAEFKKTTDKKNLGCAKGEPPFTVAVTEI